MKPIWTNRIYSIFEGTEIATGRNCFIVKTAKGEDTGKYYYRLDKAILKAEEFTEENIETEEDYPHCVECDEEPYSDHYHVYVIELDDSVKEEKWKKICANNSDPDENATCFYVGYTKHKVTCRYEQHVSYFEEEESYYCECYKSGPQTRYFRREDGSIITRGSPIAGEYAVCLRPEFYYKFNPIYDRDEAMDMEVQLAERLREMGYNVIQG
jgi:hypothetical protein